MTASSWKYFALEELKCKCGKCNSTGLEMDNQFMQQLVMLREKLGFPFVVSSAYRCPHHNNDVSSSGFKGAHTTGKAIDIAVVNEKALDLIKEALKLNITGIGVNQKGNGRFIHLDSCTSVDGLPRPNIWSY